VTGQEVAFLVLAVVGGLSALFVVTTGNIVHAALYLIITLATLAGTYLLLAAPFLAFVQIIVYIGAIVVLFLFGIMMTRAPIGRKLLDNPPRARLGAAVVGGATFAMLSVFLAQAFGGERIDPDAFTGIESLGSSIFTNYVLPFEAVSLLLLAALVGAIVLSRRD
jgi:NADH-quinone oxidoreductase subunit J